MPDVAAPAPAPVATTSATPPAEPQSAPGAGTPPEAAKPEPKKRGKERHAEIRAKVAAAKQQAAGDKPPAPAAAPPAADKKDSQPPSTEPEKPKPAVGAVMRLTAENTKLKAELDEARGKLEASSKGETVASLRERVKKDPAVLFDVFGEDLDADENARLTKLNDAVLRRADPAYAEQRDRDERVAKLERELAEERASKEKLTQAERDHRAAQKTGQLLTEGHKDESGAQVIDPAKFPYVNHLTKVGEIDAHRGVMFAVRDMANDFRKAKGRDPSDAEIFGFINIAAEQAETYFAKKAKNWSLPQAAQPAAAPAPEARPTPTTIGSGMGARPGGIDTRALTKRERHELIKQRLREANRNRQAVPN